MNRATRWTEAAQAHTKMTPPAATTSCTLTELSAREQETDCPGIVNVVIISRVGAAENLIVAFTVSATDNKARWSLEGDVAVMDMWDRSQNQCDAAVDLQRCAVVFNDNHLGFHSKASYKLFRRGDSGNVAIERNRRYRGVRISGDLATPSGGLGNCSLCYLPFSSFKKLLITLHVFSN